MLAQVVAPGEAFAAFDANEWLLEKKKMTLDFAFSQHPKMEI